jgi:hypothetical protein
MKTLLKTVFVASSVLLSSAAFAVSSYPSLSNSYQVATNKGVSEDVLMTSGKSYFTHEFYRGMSQGDYVLLNSRGFTDALEVIFPEISEGDDYILAESFLDGRAVRSAMKQAAEYAGCMIYRHENNMQVAKGCAAGKKTLKSQKDVEPQPFIYGKSYTNGLRVSKKTNNVLVSVFFRKKSDYARRGEDDAKSQKNIKAPIHLVGSYFASRTANINSDDLILSLNLAVDGVSNGETIRGPLTGKRYQFWMVIPSQEKIASFKSIEQARDHVVRNAKLMKFDFSNIK